MTFFSRIIDQPPRGVLPAIVCVMLFFTSATYANQYKILITEATFASKKTVGEKEEPWDFPEGKPDPYVVVAINDEPVYISGKAGDTLKARWFTGSEYWRLPTTAKVTITVRDADAAKVLATAGMVGVATRPDIPRIGKRLINDALAKVDTDDTIAVWSGTLGQLLNACGSANRTTDILHQAAGKKFVQQNNGLTSLHVRVIERDDRFDVTQATSSSKQYLGLSGAAIEKIKRGIKQPWDVGLSGASRPDPHYLVYVNGSAVAAGGINKDAYQAIWSGDMAAMDLRADDTLAVAIFDADAGAELSAAGKAAVLFSSAFSETAKEKLFESLTKMSTDDPIFLWVGDWKTLSTATALPRGNNDPNVWLNDGLARATLITSAPVKQVASKPMRLTIKAAEIAATKADGKAWDIRKGQPDPLVKCFIASATGGWASLGESASVKDSLQPTWKLVSADKRIVTGARIKLDVFDKDGLSNDLIGTIIFNVPAKPGSYTVKGGQVSRLTVVLE